MGCNLSTGADTTKSYETKGSTTGKKKKGTKKASAKNPLAGNATNNSASGKKKRKGAKVKGKQQHEKDADGAALANGKQGGKKPATTAQSGAAAPQGLPQRPTGEFFNIASKGTAAVDESELSSISQSHSSFRRGKPHSNDHSVADTKPPNFLGGGSTGLEESKNSDTASQNTTTSRSTIHKHRKQHKKVSHDLAGGSQNTSSNNTANSNNRVPLPPKEQLSENKIRSVRLWIDLSEKDELLDPQDVAGFSRQQADREAARQKELGSSSVPSETSGGSDHDLPSTTETQGGSARVPDQTDAFGSMATGGDKSSSDMKEATESPGGEVAKPTSAGFEPRKSVSHHRSRISSTQNSGLMSGGHRHSINRKPSVVPMQEMLEMDIQPEDEQKHGEESSVAMRMGSTKSSRCSSELPSVVGAFNQGSAPPSQAGTAQPSPQHRSSRGSTPGSPTTVN